MKPSKTTRRRRRFNKKTYRNKKRGGMHRPKTPKDAKVRAEERAAAHTALIELPGISPGVRLDTLTHRSALADVVAARFLKNQQMSMSLPGHARTALGREPIPAIFEAHDMFRQAEKLSLDLRTLTEEETWTQEHRWSSKNFTPEAKGMCMEAAQLYSGAVDRKYLPAYAPLAWMMSYTNPEQSLRLCDTCIRACDARVDVPFAIAREAKTDCTAIRAFVQYQEDVKELQDELETRAPTPQGWGMPETDASFMKELHAIAKESIDAGSKYGYALRWLLLSNDFEKATRNETEIDQAQRNAEAMGLDFQRCRFCFVSTTMDQP